MIVLFPAKLDCLPRPIGGLDAFRQAFRYPPIALQADYGGTVIVQFTVDRAGNTRDARVLKEQIIFQGPVIAAISEAHFEPAKSGNSPVDVTLKLGVHFSVVHLTEVVETPPISVSQITLVALPGLVPGPPDFTLTIDSSGVSTFEGRSGVDLIGSFTGTCSSSNFKRLASLLRDICFFESWYRKSNPEVLFAARQQITAVGNGEEMSHWDCDDECGWGLALIIEGVARQIKWTRVH
jgi:TonB family protein